MTSSFSRGKTGKFVKELTTDFRQVMEPFTASNIKVRPKNVIKDFVQIAGMMKVSHLVMFTKTARGPYMKLGRFPRGPTITFRVEDYVLGKDVRSSLKRQVTYAKQYANHALLIMNNFSKKDGDKSLELVESMFQNMFPSINPNKVKVNSIRRCVMLNYNTETKMIDFRHYTIKLLPVGLNRGVKKIVSSRVPDLGRCGDMSELLSRPAPSDSEGEEDETSHVAAPKGVSVRGVLGGATSSVKLVELGPRMSLRLVKIEEGLLDGEILHHEFVQKTDEEKKEIRDNRERRKREKEKRRKEQEKNVRKKEKEKQVHKEKTLEGMNQKEMKKKISEYKEEQKSKGEEGVSLKGDASSDDDDAAYYQEEVGEKPDKDLFSSKSGSSKGFVKGKRFSSKKKEPANRFGGRDSKKDQKSGKKRKVKVFNSDGVGPNFKKGGGKEKLRGVKTGRIAKKKRK